ncbi:MAG TPA: hypothetical protein VLS90_10840 [Thermodesulfobacteriota bacterium]|nr:hypothetical protein [Thermodesulfobacteriota bacterium]
MGAAIGSQAASWAGKVFGLEVEGLSPEDQEFKVSKPFVRFAAAARRRNERITNPRRENHEEVE